jgi:CBS domain-containing protein
MRLGVVTCAPDTPVETVAQTMNVHDVSALVVTDDEGFAIGLVSRTDLVSATFAELDRPRWRTLTARQLMSNPVISVRADSPVAAAAQRMREQHVHRVVVTVPEHGRERPIGILSVTDLVEHLSAARVRPGG